MSTLNSCLKFTKLIVKRAKSKKQTNKKTVGAGGGGGGGGAQAITLKWSKGNNFK